MAHKVGRAISSGSNIGTALVESVTDNAGIIGGAAGAVGGFMLGGPAGAMAGYGLGSQLGGQIQSQTKSCRECRRPAR